MKKIAFTEKQIESAIKALQMALKNPNGINYKITENLFWKLNSALPKNKQIGLDLR